ncbi:hypothetical protein TWF506_003505 [Arthrobotrys conoides]|uniref:Uncharacterized protein n=1 Tax=Arthrobotrys conoides TaxID=74498 RepID=A0AAN8N3L1_9PEZI
MSLEWVQKFTAIVTGMNLARGMVNLNGFHGQFRVCISDAIASWNGSPDIN